MKKVISISIVFIFLLISLQFLLSNFKILQNPILDFGYFYNAGELVKAGDNPYREINGGLIRNPPPTLLLYMVFTALPLGNSQSIWFFISFICFIFGSTLLFKIIKLRGWKIWLVYLSFTFIFFPFRYNLGSGQLGNYLFLLITASFYLLQKKSYLKSAICLAIAISLKVTPAIFIPVLIVLRKFKAAVLTIIFLVLINIISGLIFGFEVFKNYFAVSESYFDFAVSNYHNQSLSGFLLQLTNNPQLSMNITFLILITFFILTFLKYNKLPTNNSNIDLILWNIGILLMLILPPFSWQHYFTLAIFPLITTFYLIKTKKLSNRFFIWLFISYLLMGVNIKNPTSFEQYGLLGSLILSHVFLGTVILLIINIYLLNKLKQGSKLLI